MSPALGWACSHTLSFNSHNPVRLGCHLLVMYEELKSKEKVIQGYRSRNWQSWDLTQDFGFQVQDTKVASNNYSILAI